MKNTDQAPEATSKDSGVLSNPLSFIRNGGFYWYGAGLDDRGGYGYYWSLRTAGIAYSNYLLVGNESLEPQREFNRGNGFAVRCDKSFTTLINTSYFMKNSGQTTENNRDSGVLSNPLSFLHSGFFRWHSADLVSRSGEGYYWSLRSYSTIYSNDLYFTNTSLNPQYNGTRGSGYAVRCVQILHHSH